jgi:hypothetical protein
MGIEDPELVAMKGRGKKLAEGMLELVIPEMASMVDPLNERTALLAEALRRAFWEQLRATADAVLGPVPPPPPVPVPPPVMPTELLAAFEAERVTFGTYANWIIEDAKHDPEFLHYLAWLSDQTFIDRLRAYLRHPRLQQRLRDLPPRKFRSMENS